MRSAILLLAGLFASFGGFSQAETAPAVPDSAKSMSIPYATFTAGLLVPNPEPIPGTDVGSVSLPIHIKMTATYGLMANEKASVGLGSGLIILDRGMVLPLFFEARGDFLKGDITPIWYGQMGSIIPLYNVEESTDWWGNQIYEDFKARGGLMFDLGIGLKVKNGTKSATMISIGYQTLNLTESYTAWGTKYDNSYQFQRLSIQAGWMF